MLAMNNPCRKISTFSCYFSIIHSNQEPKVNCLLKGEIIDRESKALILFKWTADHKVKKEIVIPIEKGRFEFLLEDAFIEAYILAFKEETDKGGFMPVIFFPQDGEVNFKIHSRELAEKNTISGGPVNKELMAYYASFKEKFGDLKDTVLGKMKMLMREKRYYTKEVNNLFKEIRSTKDPQIKTETYQKIEALKKQGKDLSPEGKKANKEYQAYNLKTSEWSEQYINDHITYLSYYWLFRKVRFWRNGEFPVAKILKQYELFAQKFPHHPYTSLLKKRIQGYASVKIGKDLIDFNAPDLGGNKHQLSTLAKDKVTLLNLWSTTCSSCIGKSRTMVPIYEDYKDKGFTVIGVAREFGNTDKLVERLEKEKFPWINLIDLDGQLGIWSKYNIPNASGQTFLIDEQGKILEINPTAGSIRKILRAKEVI